MPIIIQAPLSPPGGQVAPQLNPASFGEGGRALEGFAQLAQQEIDRRIEQKQAVDLANLRATAQTRISSFMQDLERNPDFRAYPGTWDAARTQIFSDLQVNVDPLVWDAFTPEWASISGNAGLRVRDLAYAREDEHNVAELTSSQNMLIDQAGLPGVDHNLNIQMIQENYLEAYRSGLISEPDAVNFARRDVESYRYNQEYAAIGRDPVGWLSGQGAAPSAGPVAIEPGATDHLTGSGANGTDNSGRPVADASPEVQAEFAATRDALNAAGRAFGAPIRVSNIYRSPEHNEAVDGATDSQHMHGTAADIVEFSSMPEADQVRLIQSLVDAGFTSFGFYGDGSLHVDRRPNPAMWAHTDGQGVPLLTHTTQPVIDAILERRQNPQPIQVAGAQPVDQDGFPIDTSRPIVTDDEGRHTELSTTLEIDGRWYNVPSIWDGRRYDPMADQDYIVQRVLADIERGWEFPNYATREEAERAAPLRSQAIDRVRLGDRSPSVPSAPVVPGLSPQQNEALYNRALREAERALAAERIAVQGQAQDYLTALTLEAPAQRPSDAAIMHAYMTDPAEGADLIAGLRRAESLAGEISSLHGMTNAEINTLLAAEQDALRAGGPNLTERAQRVDALQSAAGTILEAREDPAGYVVSRDEDLRQRFEVALSAEGTPDQLRDAIRMSLEAQTFIEPMDRVPLPDALLSSVMDQYNRIEDVGERVRSLQSITTALGDDDAASLVLNQLEEAGLDPAWRYIIDANVSDARRTDLANLLLDPEAEERWKQRYPEDDSRNRALNEALTAYDQARGFVYDGRIAVLGNVGNAGAVQQADRDVAERLAIALATRTGNPEQPSAAMDRAVEILFGDQRAIDDSLGFAFVPKDQAQLITAGMETVRADLLDIVPLAEFGAMLGDAGIPEQVAAVTWRGMVEDALWVNHGGGYALAMPVSNADSIFGRLLVDASGNVRVWSADDLMAVPRVLTQPDTLGMAVVP